MIKAIIKGVIGIFDFSYYKGLLESYQPNFGVGGWIFAILAFLLLAILVFFVVFLLLKAGKRIATFRLPLKENERMKDELLRLNQEMLKLNYEKDKILAMKVSSMGMNVQKELLTTDQDIDMAAAQDGIASTNSVNLEKTRFTRLTEVDQYYLTQYQPPVYDDDINLEDICKQFRNYAASQLNLYYDLSDIKYFIASFGATRTIILQGISGTGKTSLPYAFGKFIDNSSAICAVQPSWRDRTELFGYFNEFTKKYNETDFLKALYEANFYQDMRLIVLDEMNIARVEYYFAEMLSVLEMPRLDEQKVNIVPSMWDNDPQKIVDGKIAIMPNIWFVGTINNDDSTFAVSDKVYDRAIPIDLDKKALPFDAPQTDVLHVTYEHIAAMFDDAKKKYPVSQDLIDKLNLMDQYVIKHFRLAFGNRIMKQLLDFVPCYIACGGEELDGIDFMIAKKILRKFESLNLGFVRDEVDGLVRFLDSTFGENTMPICKEYLLRLKKLS
ncbi:hypothetical protein [Anaerosporobacter faecicola]|uniref:hypothetical protein n=1 Tax=Anaerosporobacter faecicola TaxID=2718714 RepID=UPI00143C2F1A|nr:hypothetical protein [Anaerosporobacter faecicola]